MTSNLSLKKDPHHFWSYFSTQIYVFSKKVFIDRSGLLVYRLRAPPQGSGYNYLLAHDTSVNTFYYCHTRKNALKHHFKLYSFCWWGRKIIFCTGRRIT